jgi:hypothetical protein
LSICTPFGTTWPKLVEGRANVEANKSTHFFDTIAQRCFAVFMMIWNTPPSSELL